MQSAYYKYEAIYYPFWEAILLHLWYQEYIIIERCTLGDILQGCSFYRSLLGEWPVEHIRVVLVCCFFLKNTVANLKVKVRHRHKMPTIVGTLISFWVTRFLSNYVSAKNKDVKLYPAGMFTRKGILFKLSRTSISTLPCSTVYFSIFLTENLSPDEL